jgi:D-beta-D-heptose 7-phosphate kinase/D-beta-D-heptose 1-phosphate adenosyltransferase
MKLTMPTFDKAQVLVVGDVMLDRYWSGGTSRISPEAPVPVVKVSGIEDRPGGAANVAMNIAALGGGVTLSGLVGADEAGEALSDRLKAASVYCDFTRSEGHPTITKLRVISQQQQLLRMDFEESFVPADALALAKSAASLVSYMGAVILSDYDKGALVDPQLIIQPARASGVPVFVDPKGTDFTSYRGATLLTPNIHEFEAVVGACASEAELVEKGQGLLADLSLDALLVTRGSRGMTLLRPDLPEFHLPARAREVFDVTGAGDTVISVLAASVAAGESLPQAVALANLAASLVVAKLGTATVSGPELRWALMREEGSERGVMSEEQLLIAVADARAQDEKIVFTNGCFDIIHAGHVAYLEQARALGDRLVVAVNGDASITRLKGLGRPINPVDRRLQVLAGLQAVDWVVSFEGDTPEALLQRVKPDLLVKGGDYAKEAVVGWEIVESYGGEVKPLSFHDNLSTTAIVESIKREQSTR